MIINAFVHLTIAVANIGQCIFFPQLIINQISSNSIIIHQWFYYNGTTMIIGNPGGCMPDI